MVVARTRFLDSGVYQPLAEKLSDICLNLIKNISNIEDETICLMDAGCGEGYYFNKIFGCLVNYEADNELSFVGLDISKPAIHEAAKRNKLITWLVGTNRQPPLAHDSVDVITCVFGFQSFEGFSKILKAGGKVVLVEPGPDHLCELREIIYTDVKKTSPPDMTAVLKSGFSLIESHNLKFKTSEINNVTINNLLLMTPHFYRANKEGREQAENIDKLSLTVDIVYRVLTKD